VPPGYPAEPESDLVAEVIVTTADGEQVRGSGYRVSGAAVLTAAHVVRAAESVSLRFNARQRDEWSAIGTVLPTGSTGDIAIVLIERADKGPRISPLPLGSVGDRSAVLESVAVGFPRFKLKRHEPGEQDESGTAASGVQYRDRVQAVGRIPVLSNSKEGTLEFITDPPDQDPDPEHSPWEGMSGAAVWTGGRIIGVVSKHHRADSTARLAVARLDRWLSGLAGAELARAGPMLGLAEQQRSLPDVIPRPPGEALAIGYIDQVRDLAPDELLERDGELADLVRFCAGDQPYAWWQAGPWAGKSALAAWLVLHPPAGIKVVSFFITSRWAGQADSDAFTTELIQQLAVIAGGPEPSAATPATREKARRYLLQEAVARCAADRQRLLLVVDGLDEDQSAVPGGTQLPSIASLLPLKPPAALRVLVTSRPEPGLPPDVPPGHPLAHCAVRRLTPSPHALEIAKLARIELKQRRASSDTRVVDVLGYLTASGGGLTRTEISHLTGLPGWMLLDLFSSVFGRTLESRTARDTERVYLFAHETLSKQAAELFRADLPRYRRELDRWADSFREQDWPADTPRYLLAPYGRLLATIGDPARLARFAADPARHDCMLAREHNDGLALAEILSARRALMPATRPDVTALGKLAVSEWRLQTRNADIPVRLPALWARLGDPNLAEQTARTITNPDQRAVALAELAAVLSGTDAGRADRLAQDAERTARAITDDPYERAAALGAVAAALAGTDPDRAEQIASGITVLYRKARALSAIACALTGADPERANRLAAAAEQASHAITEPYLLYPALISVVTAFAGGDSRHAERVARTLPGAHDEAEALAAVAAALASTHPDTARQLAAEAEETARDITDPGLRAEALAAAAARLARTDSGRALRLAEDAEAVIGSISYDSGRDNALAHVAAVLVGHDPDRAERVAHTVTHVDRHSDALAALVTALARRDPERAERVAHTITQPGREADALTGLAVAVADADPARAARIAADAERAARTSIDPYQRGDALAAAAAALIGTSPERAERAARAITVADPRARSLALLAAGLAASDPGHADRLGADAEQAAGAAIIDRAEVLADVAGTLAPTEPQRAARLVAAAEEYISGIRDSDRENDALSALAVALARTDPDRGERTARRIASDYWQAKALTDVAVTLAKTSPDRAQQIALSITEPGFQARALAATAAALAATDAPRAHQLAARAEDSARAITGAAVRADTLADLATAFAPTDPARASQMVAEAVHAARQSTHPHWRAQALTSAANAIAAAAADPDGARRVLADAMFAEGVFTTLTRLQPFWPDEAIGIAEHTMLCTGTGS
jgi:Trypsin-like peptidase domain